MAQRFWRAHAPSRIGRGTAGANFAAIFTVSVVEKSLARRASGGSKTGSLLATFRQPAAIKFSFDARPTMGHGRAVAIFQKKCSILARGEMVPAGVLEIDQVESPSHEFPTDKISP